MSNVGGASVALRTHRTQDERSAATRSELLNATIESLVEVGYAGMSTNDVVRRARVSRGAQAHHYPRKDDLVQAAIMHLALKVREELLAELERIPQKQDRVEAALERLWGTYDGPMFWASMEVIIASRTHPELRGAVTLLDETITETLHRFYSRLLGSQELAEPRVGNLVKLSGPLLNGLAIAKLQRGDDWCRGQLRHWMETVRALLEQAVPEPGNSEER